MGKYLSADEFLAGITGESVDFEIAGLGTVKVRALEFAEIQKIDREAKGDNLQSALLMVLYGLVEPALTQANLEALQKAKPGIIRQLSDHVSKISGMGQDPEKND